MTVLPNHAISVLILNFIAFYGEKNKVEARPKEVIPVPGWFNNVEGFVVPNLHGLGAKNPNHMGKNVGTVEIIDALKKTKNKKKRKHLVKKGAKKLQKEEGKDKWSVFKLTKKKKKHKSKGNLLKFIKSKVNDNDSGVSQSNEKQPSRKSPVDIVVHIKMND